MTIDPNNFEIDAPETNPTGARPSGTDDQVPRPKELGLAPAESRHAVEGAPRVAVPRPENPVARAAGAYTGQAVVYSGVAGVFIGVLTRLFSIPLYTSITIIVALFGVSLGMLIYLNPERRILNRLDETRARLDTPSPSSDSTGSTSATVAIARSLNRERQAIRERLRAEVAALQRRGNLNLVIGSTATLAAGGLLAFVVYEAPELTAGWYSFAAYYVARFAVVILAEIFAFFFLRLYRATLDEGKYFQNELTNVEMRLLAMDAAVTIGDAIIQGDIIREIARTERNVVLRGGETTVELEKLRGERDAFKELAQAAATVASSRAS